MAKALGLIGNFTGKLGNTVGYNLKDSNNKQTQGVRVYQPVVKNPRTYAQALQRAKLAPINATYRLLKNIIDRGQESIAYGNKSRLAWLSYALRSYAKPYFVKGAVINLPGLVQLSKGSLSNPFIVKDGWQNMECEFNATLESAPKTIGALSTALLASGNGLQNGDQLTFVMVDKTSDNMSVRILSIVLATTSTDNLPSFITATTSAVKFAGMTADTVAGCCIISREGSNGEHLRSTSVLHSTTVGEMDYVETVSAKIAAKSYMNEDSNTDWAEESIM